MGLIEETALKYYNVTQEFTGDGSDTTFTLTFSPLPSAEDKFIVYVGGEEQDDDNYTYDDSTGVITFTTAPANGKIIKVVLKNKRHGSYRYISLEDIINNFMVAYVGDGKLIDFANRTDILFHVKRGMQEFSYDISRVEKIQEVEIPSTLTLPMPQDYVNYVKIAWFDENGVERIIYPSSYTSRPSEAVLQDDDGVYLTDNDESLLTSNPLITEKFNAVTPKSNQDKYASNSDFNNSEVGLGRNYGSEPAEAQRNGVFIIDEANGQFGFSSNLNGKVIVIKYISDGLGTDAEMQVHKMAEEAIYKHTIHAVLSSKANVPEYVVNRFKRERRAAMRNAKLRLYNLKQSEIAQVMRGKSKWIKH